MIVNKLSRKKISLLLFIFLPHLLFFIALFRYTQHVSGGDLAFRFGWIFSYLLYFLIISFVIILKIQNKLYPFIVLLLLLLVELFLNYLIF